MVAFPRPSLSDLIFGTVILLSLGITLWKVWPERPPKISAEFLTPISFEGRRTIGVSSAPVGLIIFSDFECPFCRKFARDSWPMVLNGYITPGKVLATFWNLPLPGLHPMAIKAAAAAECAGRQGLFWPVHDLLFGVEDDQRWKEDWLSEASVQAHLRVARVDLRQFEDCYPAAGAAVVQKDLERAESFGVTGTPTLFLGRMQPDHSLKVLRIVKGVTTAAGMKQILDDIFAVR